MNDLHMQYYTHKCFNYFNPAVKIGSNYNLKRLEITLLL